MQHELDITRACARRLYDQDRASQQLGIDIDVLGPGRADASMPVRADMVNGHDICHGGFIFALADTAFAFACNSPDRVSVAAGASIEFIAPARAGDRLQAQAREVRRGRRSGICDVRVTDAAGTLIALFRGRSAAIDKPEPD